MDSVNPLVAPSRLVVWLAVVGMSVALLALGGLALWTTIASQDRAARLSYAGVQTSGHLRATQALGQLDSYADLMADERPTAEIDAGLADAKRVLDDALTRMQDGANLQARRLASAAARDVRRLAPALERLRVATRSGDPQRVDDADDSVDDLLESLQRRFDDFKSDPSDELRAEAAAAVDGERSTRALAIVLIPAGLLCLSLCLWVLGAYRRRWEAASRASLEQHHHDARTDDLTGLGNRRALIEIVEERLEASQSFVLGLADLNGFKHYNDTYGHSAGDALLRRLAEKLARACRGRTITAVRLGGDEFCVVAGADTSDEDLRDLLQTALSEEGHGFAISSACGFVRVPQQAQDISAALRLADARMYAAKGDSRRSTTERQMSRALLRMLDERHPGLGDHVEEVAELAAACGATLGLSPDAVQALRQAGELHDIGKVAIPDAILHKRGALTEDESRFMREHTVIGERVLAAVSFMEPVARIVRCSHERWDGGGYPDGLAGEQIPLAARIISVADAYSAMTEERPYRRASTPRSAILELQRCAGSQFDPAVVDAFIKILAARASRSRPVAA